MYQLVKTITKNDFTGLISGILYMIAPYRLLNAYTRLAVGEMVSFIFIPIIFRGVYYIFNDNTKKSYLFILGSIALVLSHNISTLLVFIVGLLYVIVNFDKLKNKCVFKTLCISAIIIILSVLFFELPLLEQQASADYEVFRYGKMYSNSSVMGHALNPLQLLYRNAPGPDSSMYFCIGISILFGLILTPFVYKNEKKDINYKFFLIVGCIAIIMSTLIFPWFVMPDILLMIQFPWRMLVLVIFCLSIISGINISKFIEYAVNKFKDKSLLKNKNTSFIKIGTFSIIILISYLYSMSFVLNLEYKIANNEYYQEEEIIDPTNQVSRYSSFLEYWPQKAIDSIDYIINRDNKIAITSGNAEITNESKLNGILNFEINNVTDNTTLELPYLFYKGYQISYTPVNLDGELQLEISESDKGLLQVNIDSSISGTINVEYHITTLHKVCLIISFTTMVIYFGYLIFCIIRNIKYKKKEC